MLLREKLHLDFYFCEIIQIRNCFFQSNRNKYDDDYDDDRDLNHLI